VQYTSTVGVGVGGGVPVAVACATAWLANAANATPTIAAYK
jgi:hypothetical protein